MDVSYRGGFYAYAFALIPLKLKKQNWEKLGEPKMWTFNYKKKHWYDELTQCVSFSNLLGERYIWLRMSLSKNTKHC